MKNSLDALGASLIGEQQTTSAKIATIMREAILSGLLKGGQPLVQDELAIQFGVSKIPVREALRQLEGEGLVTSHRNRGVVVTRLSNEEIEELCDIRIALETMLIGIAVPHITPEIIYKAESILNQVDNEIDIQNKWGEFNWQFHELIYSSAGRPYHLKLIHAIHLKFDRYLRVHLSLLDYKEKGQSEHRQILSACQRHATAEAVELTRQHILSVKELLGGYLKSQ